MIEGGGSLLRFNQYCATLFGLDVRSFRIENLTPTEYRENPATDVPVLCGSGTGWNQHGMHHLNAQRPYDGRLIACVDG